MSKTVKKNVLQGMNISKLADMRIIQKHLVYVIGLSSQLANKEILNKYEYFGQYGTILKIVVNKTKAYNPNGPSGPSYSAYISYSTDADASIAILAIDNIEVDDHILRASYGTTKYCTFFLKNQDCPNKDCLYLHHLADESDIINRDDMNSNTNVFYEQQLLAMKISDIFNQDTKKKLKNINLKKKCIFPSTDTIYTKDIVLEQNNDCNYYSKKNDYYYKKNYAYNEEDEEYFYDENENLNLVKEKSENFTTQTKFNSSHKKPNYMNLEFSNDPTAKFISKSKSPITTKKKNIPDIVKGSLVNNSLSPVMTKKVDFDEKLNETVYNNLNEVPTSTINSPPEIKKLYRKRDESRFSFVKNNIDSNHPLNNINVYKKEIDKNSKFNLNLNSDTCTNDKENIVPDYVSDVICKKISRHTFFKKFDKYFSKENDTEYFEKQLKQNDSWSEFILSNLNVNNGNVEKIK